MLNFLILEKWPWSEFRFAHTSRLHVRFVQATYLGKTEVTAEFIVSDMSGHVFVARTIRRLTAPERHRALGLEKVQKQLLLIRSQATYPDREVIFELQPDRERGLDACVGLPVPPPGQTRQHEPETPRPQPDGGFGMVMPEPIGPRLGMETPKDIVGVRAGNNRYQLEWTGGRATEVEGTTEESRARHDGERRSDRRLIQFGDVILFGSSGSQLERIADDPFARQESGANAPTRRSCKFSCASGTSSG